MTWTHDEVKLLKQTYRYYPIWYIAQLLGKTENAVRNKAWKLGLKSEAKKTWTPNKLQFLIENYDKMTVRELAEKLNKTEQAIIRKACDLKITKFNNCGNRPMYLVGLLKVKNSMCCE